MGDATASLYNVFKAFCTRRRAAEDTPPKLEIYLSGRLHTKSMPTSPACSDGACKSTDTSGTEHVSDSSDGFDTDSSELMPNSEPTTGGETDLSDVEMPQGGRATRLNPQAACFVPSQSLAQEATGPLLRDSIRAVVRALEDWEGSKAAEEVYSYQENHKSPAKSIQSQTFSVLQQALANLPPQDAVMVRAFVDSKVALTPVCQPVPQSAVPGVQLMPGSLYGQQEVSMASARWNSTPMASHSAFFLPTFSEASTCPQTGVVSQRTRATKRSQCRSRTKRAVK